MKIYTRGGDTGETGLFGGSRVRKDVARTEALGAVDELNCLIGLTRTESLAQPTDALLARVQRELFEIGAELSSPDPVAAGTRTIAPAHVASLEGEIDRYQGALAPLRHFILPGGSRVGAMLHLARAVCRRAERRLVTLSGESPQPMSPVLVAYLNRLGDLLFVLARSANQDLGVPDVTWQRP